MRRLERMNAVHPQHTSQLFARYRHFVFAFHDTTFECVAESFDVAVHTGSVVEILERSFTQIGQ